MIIDGFLSVLADVLGFLLNLLPSWSPLTIDTSALSDFAAFTYTARGIAFANQFIPLSEAFVLLGLLLTVWLAAHLYAFVVWVLTKLHILGGASN